MPPAANEVTRIVLHRVRIPLVEPLAAAHGTEEHREVVIVETVDENGLSGWGECVALSRPTYTSEYTDGAWALLRDVMAPRALTGSDFSVDGAPMAFSALAASLEDLEGRQTGRSIATTTHGSRVQVACTAVVGRQSDVDSLLAVVERRVNEGYGSVKLKISPGWALDPLRAVRDAHPDLRLAADANGSFASDDGPGVLRSLDQLGLVYLEQPLAADDHAGHARLAGVIDTTIALDESIRHERDLDHALGFGVKFVVNLKPGRVGGLAEALRLRDRAERSGISMFVGGMLETGVGRAYALAFASWAVCDLPTDLGPSKRYFADDIIEPIELLPTGRLEIPTGPGIGVTPRRDRLHEVTVDRFELAR